MIFIDQWHKKNLRNASRYIKGELRWVEIGIDGTVDIERSGLEILFLKLKGTIMIGAHNLFLISWQDNIFNQPDQIDCEIRRSTYGKTEIIEWFIEGQTFPH